MAADKILSASYSSRYAEAAAATLDGATVNPLSCANSPTRLQVYSIASSGAVAWNGLAHDRGDGNNAGGCQYGEILVYSRRLTADERREVTAYLMKKWLGKDHPDLMKSRSTAQAVIGAGEKATVSFDAAGDPVVVRTTDAVGPILARAWAHYDATIASTFANSPSAGVYKQWYDSLDTDKSGENCLLNFDGSQTVWPSRSNVVINAGKEMPIVDFGAANSSTPYSPYLKMNTRNVNNDAEEIYLIHSTAEGSLTGFFGTDNGTATADMGGYLWKRGSNGSLFESGTSSKALRYGTIRVNGAASDYSFVPVADRFYLYTFIPTIPVTASSIGHTFAGGSMNYTGGARYGEILFYKGANKNTPADQAKIEAYLMKKWFDQGYGPACDLGALALTGETMQYADAGGSCAYVLSALSGCGTLDVGENAVSDVATLSPTGGLTVEAGAVSLADPLALNVAFTSPDAWGCVNVDGAVALPQQATVSVSVPNGVKPQTGRLYPILTATTVTGDISNWTLNVSCAKRPDARLVLKPDGVYLEFIPSGMILLFR